MPRPAVPWLALAAFTNVFAWMGFSALCLRWLDVSEGVLLVFTMPIWASLFAWALLGTRPMARGFAALALGLAGVTVLLGAGGAAFGGDKPLGIAFALGAAVLFALGAVLNRKALPVPPIALTAWQVGLGCLPMVAIGLVIERPAVSALSTAGFWAMAYMTIVPMGVCYLTWFAALRRLPPAAASTSMLLVPLTGIISAALLLGDPWVRGRCWPWPSHSEASSSRCRRHESGRGFGSIPAAPTVAHAALLLDGAGWHIAAGIAVPTNVSMIFLPPYNVDGDGRPKPRAAKLLGR